MSQTCDFAIYDDGKKYLMHDLFGAPVCEFFHWREGSLEFLLRVVPVPQEESYELVKFYQMELFAGSLLRLNPSFGLGVSNFDWRLVYRKTGYRDIWDTFAKYRRDIQRYEGVASVEGFIEDWIVTNGNQESLFCKLNVKYVDNRAEYGKIRTWQNSEEIPMNRDIPHPCSRCNNSRLQDIFYDGRWILWCTDSRDEYLGDPDCPYFREKKFLWEEMPIPCNECQRFHLVEERDATLVPACSGNNDEYWGDNVCPYIKKTP